ncbi:MAG: response regulator transcription factor [Planctomycetes bacterium]|nr:response regulator transcription factor [Planctomycetota bacterium]
MSAAPSESGTPPLVLLVEDELPLVRFIEASLTSAGYRVLHAASGAQATRMATQYVPDLVLLDLGLPDVDGLTVLATLRVWFRGPILIVSARGQERRKVEALDAGADDYVTKPFGIPELLARIRVALRHVAREATRAACTVLENGPLRIDLEARRVTCAGREVHLTPIEFKLLLTLARHVGKVVTQRQLLEDVWGPRSTEETQYLRVYMTHLRRKLDPGPSGPRLFSTEAGVGYRLESIEDTGA